MAARSSSALRHEYRSRRRHRHRLPARLHPVRAGADAACRARRRAQDRFGQYRRDQRAAHRQQDAGRADGGARCRQGRGGGGDRRRMGRARDARGLGGGGARPPISRVADVPRRQGRGNRDRRAHRRSLAGGGGRGADLARGGDHVSLLVTRCARRRRGGRGGCRVCRRRRAGDARHRDCARRDRQASRQHPSSDRRHRKPDLVPAKLRQALAGRALDPEERLDWLRLCRTETIGPVTFYALLRRFGSAKAALDAVPRLGRRDLTVYSRGAAEKEVTALARLGARLVCWGEPGYPERLANIEDAPPMLTLLGRGELLTAPIVAIVGARNASANGRRLAHDLAAGLGEAGVVVASGMARGIDAAAHGGALATGSIAVVAGGVDVVYPPENRGLYQALAKDGAVVAELPLGTEPQARHFPRRNRIISGMSLGIVVVEAAAKSGSLITARFALEQGREVFAVPGSPLDPRSRGANDLLRNGATLTETAADIIEQLGPLLQGRPPAPQMALAQLRLPPNPAARPQSVMAPVPAPGAPVNADAAIDLIIEKLSPTPVAVDELVRQCQLSASAVATLLLELE